MQSCQVETELSELTFLTDFLVSFKLARDNLTIFFRGFCKQHTIVGISKHSKSFVLIVRSYDFGAILDEAFKPQC